MIFITDFFPVILEIFHICYFECFRDVSAHPSKVIVLTCKKNLSPQKRQLCPSILSSDITKIKQTCCFGYFGHIFPSPAQLIVSTYKKVWCLSTCKKWYS